MKLPGILNLGAVTWNNPTSISAGLGTIYVLGNQTATNNATLTFGNTTTAGTDTPVSSITYGAATILGANVSTNNEAITFNNAVLLGANSSVNAGTAALSFGNTLNGDYNLTAAASSVSFASAVGGATALNSVSVTSTNSLSLPAINASSILAQTTGSAADITLNGALTATGTSTAISLNAGGNFINSSSSPISATNGRWLVYSTDPANNSGSQQSTFSAFNCTGGNCPLPNSGNGFIYHDPSTGYVANSLTLPDSVLGAIAAISTINPASAINSISMNLHPLDFNQADPRNNLPAFYFSSLSPSSDALPNKNKLSENSLMLGGV